MKDIFDRESEIELLKNSLDSPLIVIMGLRRTGKTSLVKSVLNYVGSTYIFLDMRKFENKGIQGLRKGVGEGNKQGSKEE